MKKANKSISQKGTARSVKSTPSTPLQTAPGQVVSSKATTGQPGAVAGPQVASRSNKSAVSLELVNPEARTVCVAGSFNQWRPETTPLQRTQNGRWVGDLSLPPGRHEYLFVVDGHWIPDPNAKETVENPFGGTNSILSVSA